MVFALPMKTDGVPAPRSGVALVPKRSGSPSVSLTWLLVFTNWWRMAKHPRSVYSTLDVPS